MGAFHVFQIVKMTQNQVKHSFCLNVKQLHNK